MIIFLDKTFCSSPNCKNECGRKMSEQEKDTLKKMFERVGFSLPLSTAYFCGEPNNDKK